MTSENRRSATIFQYERPRAWILYDAQRVAQPLIEAKSMVMSLRTIPYQRAWVDALQQMELKREVAGTSRIEGAEFTERELDAAMQSATQETAEDLLTRSQRQVRAALRTYQWIATVPDDRPVDADLICEIHRLIVTGADDDPCEPGTIRSRDQNVFFGVPRHRGVEGGNECESGSYRLGVRLEWPTEITETTFFAQLKRLPKAKRTLPPVARKATLLAAGSSNPATAENSRGVL